MFVALKQDGQYFSLLDHQDSIKLKAMRKSETFYCPACREAVQLKIGQKKATHFSHYKESSCALHLEAESETHLNGKRQLFTWLSKQDVNLKLEPYLKSISQRPDILVENHIRKYAIEFQCSKLSNVSFQKRTRSYFSINITPIWIINADYIKSIDNQLFEVSPFLWQFLTNIRNSVLIIFYSPKQHSFYLLSSIIPFSPTLTFGHVNEIKLDDLSFQEFLQSIPPKPPIAEMKNMWIQHKKRFRLQFSIYPQKNQRSLLNALYQNRIPPSLIPSETGLPCKHMYWIHTHPFIWQLWLILDCLLSVKVGEVITFKYVFSTFCKRVVTKEIVLRELPLLTSHSHVSFAVMEYMQCLCSVGIFDKISKTEFKKVSSFMIPLNEGVTYEADRKVLCKLFEKYPL